MSEHFESWHLHGRGRSTVIHCNCCFAGSFKVSIFKTAVLYCTRMTFHSLKLSVLKCGMLLCTLPTKPYRSFPVNVRFAFLISIPSAFVLHRDIKASTKQAHKTLLSLNKPGLPAVSRLDQFPLPAQKRNTISQPVQ